MELSGCVALVTGANRGIGAAIVDALIAAGVARVYAAMPNPPGGPTQRNGIVPIALDITDAAQVAEAARV